MAKKPHDTPMLDELESGPWPSFVTGLKRLAQDKDEHGRYLPIDDVIHHTMLLFWAGYDTTASAGSWVLHLLAHHPEWQDRIREKAHFARCAAAASGVAPADRKSTRLNSSH